MNPLPKPYYSEPGITIYHADCRDILPLLPKVDLVLTDPPYGIRYDPSVSSQRGIQSFPVMVGDEQVYDSAWLLEYPDLICWGANHYAHSLPERSGQFYAWDKVIQNGLGVRIAECEYCWHKLGTKPRIFRHLWSGAYRASESGQSSQHPTQKPIALMLWCIGLSPTTGIIADPYCGSGTTLVAAKQLGRRAIGIEIEEKYCRIAVERLRQAVLPLEPAAPVPEQMKMESIR